MNEKNVTSLVKNMNSTLYCDLKNFSASYRSVHGYLSVVVCIFGSIANILNICVLTTKDMRIPTNYILTGLAISDLLVMLEYIPFVSHVYLDPNARLSRDYFSYPWAIYTYFHALHTQVFHFISCCLTVMLAIWRYIAITHPANNNIWCNPRRTKWAIFLSYILCPFVCLPIFLGLNIEAMNKKMYQNGTLILDKNSHLHNGTITTIYVTTYSDAYMLIIFYVYGVVIKLLPCVHLTVLSICLIKALRDAKKRWKALNDNSGVPLVDGSAKKQRNAEKEQQVDRTTRMLLAVLLLFLITEFPQAILGLLSIVLSPEFYKNCYEKLGDLMDIIALTNSAINFILYCSMSQQFRSAFRELFFFKMKPPARGCRETQSTKV